MYGGYRGGYPGMGGYGTYAGGLPGRVGAYGVGTHPINNTVNALRRSGVML